MMQWWNNVTIRAFRERAQCIIDQYSRYKLDEVDLYVNGRMTQGENIADNGGLKQSFRVSPSATLPSQFLHPTSPTSILILSSHVCTLIFNDLVTILIGWFKVNLQFFYRNNIYIYVKIAKFAPPFKRLRICNNTFYSSSW